MSDRHHVVVVGGGFGGLRVVKGLRRANVEITLIDRRNHYLFQPLLYQVATGGLSPANIATPLRTILRGQPNVQVLLGDVVDIDVHAQRLVLEGGGTLTYDILVVATGVRHQYFGRPEWEPLAPGLKTLEDATEIRRRILTGFEEAERTVDPEQRQAWMTFVIVGGGATGVELAGSIAELAHATMRREFRSIEPGEARILLVEGGDRLLPAFPPKLSDKTAEALRKLGVTVQTGTKVTDIRADGVTIEAGGKTEEIACRTVLWAAGVKASSLGPILGKACGASVERSGKVCVRPDLTLPDHPNIFVIGDLAELCGANGKPLPGVAQVAMQMGNYVARVIRTRMTGQTLPPFVYKDLGSMATIGRARAVVDAGFIWLWGYPAWLAWLFVHLLNIIDFGNRVLVMLQWAGNYFTRNRSARLITGGELRPGVAVSGQGAAASSADGTPSRPTVAK
jgi:NADH dehydrogenase